MKLPLEHVWSNFITVHSTTIFATGAELINSALVANATGAELINSAPVANDWKIPHSFYVLANSST
jgi:hypothetical protein